MRFIFSITFLFLFSFAFSQKKIENITSIGLHKVYNEPADGFCNSFISKDYGQVISRKINDCDNLVLELIDLKTNIKNRKSEGLCCEYGSIGCPSLQYMVTYQFNKLIDTLYFNNDEYEKVLIDWNSRKQYDDKNSDIIKLLSKNYVLKKFIETDIVKISHSLYLMQIDSMNIKDITINRQVFYGLKKNQLENLIGGFKTVNTEETKDPSIFKNYICLSWSGNAGYEFYFGDDDPIHELNIVLMDYESDENSIDTVDVSGIKVGDPETKLIEKFPNSTKYIENQKEYFKDEKGNYTITVKITDYKGMVYFELDNGKIKNITIDFKYPKN